MHLLPPGLTGPRMFFHGQVELAPPRDRLAARRARAGLRRSQPQRKRRVSVSVANPFRIEKQALRRMPEQTDFIPPKTARSRLSILYLQSQLYMVLFFLVEP